MAVGRVFWSFRRGKHSHFLSCSAFTNRMPFRIISLLDVFSFCAHASSMSRVGLSTRICSLISFRLSVGRPVLGLTLSPHFCHDNIITYVITKFNAFFKFPCAGTYRFFILLFQEIHDIINNVCKFTKWRWILNGICGKRVYSRPFRQRY